MAQDVKVLGRSRLPGGGFNTSGVASNSKIQVWAEVSITAYTANGESLTPKDLGLSSIDTIHFDLVSTEDTPTAPVIGAMQRAQYAPILRTVIILIDPNNGDTQVTTNAAAVYRCLAIGDSATPQLT